jgi:nucleotide-binding universal stress UspA family protein
MYYSISRRSDVHKKFNKIVVAIDGSTESMHAANCAIGVAKRYDAILIVLTVLPQELRYDYRIDRVDPEIPMTPVKGVVELSRMEIEGKWFTGIKKDALASNVKIETEIVIEGKSIVSDIIEYSEKQSIDLIVIGTKGKTGLKRLLLGSVSQGVLAYAHCPVLLVR